MDAQEVNSALSFLDQLLAHASALSIVLAMLGSWAFTQWAKFLVQRFATPVWHAWLTRTICATAAFNIALFTWPNDWKVVWAFTLGFGSPIAFHWALIVLYWKFPSLRDKLSAQRAKTDVVDLSPPPSE